MKDYKYIKFILVKEKPKTKVFNCVSKEIRIGEVRWYPRWRKYCYFPVDNSLYDSGCLADIQDFLDTLNREHKEGKI